MSIVKYADDIHFSLNEVYEFNSSKIASNPGLSVLLTQPENADIDNETRQRFIKFAAQLKRVAPKANDFLYFSAVMLHAAEAALIDQVTGEQKRDSKGNILTAEWEINKKGSWKWKCSDPNLRPYKNNNGDIFPEAELKKAYRKWIGRPLCKDHQSSSVDGIRGIIVDTYYDDKRKRVIGLCALDKINYPDLARKVSTGYAHDVSMGTAVGRSICFECGNVASVEAEYCPCVKTRRTYGEINVDLSPIELSLVVTGADPGAKLRSIIASLNRYSEEKEERIDELKKAGCVTVGELMRLESEIEDLKKTITSLKERQMIPGQEYKEQDIKVEAMDQDKAALIRNLSESLKNITNPETRQKIESAIADLTGGVSAAADSVVVEPPYGVAGNKAMTSGHAESATQDLKSGGPTDINNPTAFDTRFASDLNQINLKLGAMEHALRDISKGVQEANNKEEQNMSDKLRERAAARRAMFQKSAYYQGGGGVNEPQTYSKEDAEKVRNTEDKQMVGMYLDENPENLGGGKEELNLKQKLSRAELEERKLKRHALLATAEGEKKVFKLNGKQYVAEGENLVELKADDLAMDEVFGTEKKAYFQGGGGVNEPQTYPKEDAEKVRNTEDKQMVGMYLDENPENLGGGKEELSLKQKYLRAGEELRARFVLASKGDEIDKENSYWKVLAGTKKDFEKGTERELLRATGSEIYEDELDENWNVLASKQWGREVLRAIREHGLNKVAWMLKGDGFSKVAQPPMPPMPPMMDAGMGAPPPAPEAAPEEKKEESKDPVDEAIDSLTKSLEDSEKFLGDLKDSLQKTTGDTEAKLPSPAEADDDEEESEKTCEECGKYPCECEEENDASDAAAEVAEKVQEVYAALDESADELAMLAESLESRKRAGKVNNDVVTAELLRLTSEALANNVTISKEATLIVDAAKKKDKKEEEEEEPKKGKKEKKDKKEDKEEPKKGKKDKKEKEEEVEEPKKGKKEKKEKEEDEDEPKKGKKSKAEMLLENLLNARAAKRREMVRVAEEMELEVGEPDGDETAALKAKIQGLEAELAKFKGEEKAEIASGEEPASAHPGLAEELGLEIDEFESDDEMYADTLDEALKEAEKKDKPEPLKTSSERKAWRESIAAEVGSKYQLKLTPEVTVETDMPLHETHKLEGLDIKTDEATFEGIVDMHEEIMRQVKSLPKVREAMEHLGNMLKSGQLGLNELENQTKLVALAVDPAAAKYWKDYFNQGDKDCKTFGTELVKEYVSKKAELNVEDQKLRLKRAFDLALDMQEKEIIGEGRATLMKQAEDLAKLDDANFESLKKVVARSNKKLNKKASQAPALNVGVNSSEDIGEGTDSPDLTNALSRMWDK